MERDIEAEESRYISLYSSEYLGEAFDFHAAQRETFQDEKHSKVGAADQAQASKKGASSSTTTTIASGSRLTRKDSEVTTNSSKPSGTKQWLQTGPHGSSSFLPLGNSSKLSMKSLRSGTVVGHTSSSGQIIKPL